MRVRVLSDLHLEFGSIELPPVEADLVIFAGDVHVKQNGFKWIREHVPELPVVYLMGNHEFYGAKFPRLIEKLQAEAAGTNVHVLENGTIELGGYRIFGATLWTDMRLHGDSRLGMAEALRMNDYKRVRKTPSYRKLRPADTQAQHFTSVNALRKFLSEGEPSRNVVVTHHAPSMRSLPERRRAELISCAYASHLDGLIEEFEPLVWIHGHIHHSQNYTIGETRILSNPRAYIDDPNPNFDPALVIDLDEIATSSR